jgi:succinate dehydrogenase / fumarate reductase cytochrome b subunit
MALKRNVGLWQGLKYRGGGPMIAWLFHRIGGVCIVILVSMHILASFSDYQLGSSLGRTVNTVYESIYFQVFVYFFLIFHVINGLRIIILDTWPQLLEYQRESTWLEWAIFIPVYGMTLLVMILRSISGE